MFRIILKLKAKIVDTYGGRRLYQKMKTTFDFIFDLYTCLKHNWYTKTWKHRKAIKLKNLLFNYL